MSAYWHFYALPENEVRQFVSSVRKMISEGDLEAWRNLCAQLERHELSAVLKLTEHDEILKTKGRAFSNLAELTVDRLPRLTDRSLQALLREITLATAQHHLVSRDSTPGYRFSELEVGLEDEDEELEYELLLHTIFRAGTRIPEPFDFLSGGDTASVSLISSKSVANLMRLEERSQFLRRLSNDLRRSGDVLGLDLEDLLRLMQVANSKGFSLYYYEPGT